MKIVKVHPLAKGIFKESLSYFTSKPVAIGSIVVVEVRKKKVVALVVSVEDARAAKLEVRSASYTMKKVDELKGEKFYLPEFVGAAEETAAYFAITTGNVLQTLTPKSILTEHDTFHFAIPDRDTKHTNLAPEKFLLQGSDKERFANYKSIIREEFAKQSSVLLCMPTVEDAKLVMDSIERGIGEYTFILHHKLKKAELLSSWEHAVTKDHPVLIITTGSFLSIPRPDINTIIVDKENSNAYRTFARPYFDIRTFAELFARRAGMRIIFGDVFLRPETLFRRESGEFTDWSPLKFRSLSSAEQKIVDTKPARDETKKKHFSALSNELLSLVKKGKAENEHTFIFVARRGLSGVTVCNDCGDIVKCSNCNTPMVLHKGTSGNVFLCHKCGEVQNAETTCRTCNSWRLVDLGIGIEKVEAELAKHLPDIKVFRIDSDSTTTPKAASNVIKNFLSAPGSVLLGTEMALHYLGNEIDNVAVASVDSLFSLPDFRIEEKIFHLLISLRAKATKHFLIQTRNTDNTIFEHALRGNILDFYRDEIAMRKALGYPPFKILIKVSHFGAGTLATREIGKLEKTLAPFEPITFTGFAPKRGGKRAENLLIKLDPDAWVDDHLLEILRGLPPSFVVNVDPEDLL